MVRFDIFHVRILSLFDPPPIFVNSMVKKESLLLIWLLLVMSLHLSVHTISLCRVSPIFKGLLQYYSCCLIIATHNFDIAYFVECPFRANTVQYKQSAISKKRGRRASWQKRRCLVGASPNVG